MAGHLWLDRSAEMGGSTQRREDAEPLLFVTAEATEGLLATLDEILLPQVRALVGDERRVTIAFDREGWSPKLFEKWKGEKFDVLRRHVLAFVVAQLSTVLLRTSAGS